VDKKKSITSTAIELFSKNGIQSTQIIEIENQLGMSKKTIDLEFQSKEKVVETYLNVVLKEQNGRLNGIVGNESILVDKLAIYLKTIYSAIKRFSIFVIDELRKDCAAIAKEIRVFINESVFYRFNKLLDIGESEGALRPGISVISSTLVYLDTITIYLTNLVNRELPELSKFIMKKNQFLPVNLVTKFRGLFNDPLVTVFNHAVNNLTLKTTTK